MSSLNNIGLLKVKEHKGFKETKENNENLIFSFKNGL